jgi:hypothetical protein
MRNLDILAAENGEHIRVLLCGEEQCYVSAANTFGCRTPLHRICLQNYSPSLPKHTLFSFWTRTSPTASARGAIASST